MARVRLSVAILAAILGAILAPIAPIAPRAARADPPEPGAKPPLCVPAGAAISLVAVAGAPVACWSATGDCVELGASDADRKVVAHPAPPAATPPAAEVRDDSGALSACAATCKPLGKRLAAAIAKSRGDGTHPLVVTATADLAIVALDGDVHTAWSVARDAELRVTPPKAYRRFDHPAVVGAHAVGNALIVDWSDCAGPCGRGQLVDATGANRGATFEAGSAVALDARRLAIAGENGSVAVVDAATGKLLATIGVRAQAGVAALLGGDEIGVLATLPTDRGVDFARVQLPATGKPSTTAEQTIAACP